MAMMMTVIQRNCENKEAMRSCTLVFGIRMRTVIGLAGTVPDGHVPRTAILMPDLPHQNHYLQR